MRVGYGPSVARCGPSEETASDSGEHKVWICRLGNPGPRNFILGVHGRMGMT